MSDSDCLCSGSGKIYDYNPKGDACPECDGGKFSTRGQVNFADQELQAPSNMLHEAYTIYRRRQPRVVATEVSNLASPYRRQGAVEALRASWRSLQRRLMRPPGTTYFRQQVAPTSRRRSALPAKHPQPLACPGDAATRAVTCPRGRSPLTACDRWARPNSDVSPPPERVG